MEPLTTAAVAMGELILEKSLDKSSLKLSQKTLKSYELLKQKIKERFSNDVINIEALAELENSESEDLRKNSLKKVTEHLQEEISKDPEFAEDIQVNVQDLLTQLKNENSQFAQDILDKFEQIIEQSNDNVRQDINSLEKKINDINVNIAQGDYIGRDPYIFTNVQEGRTALPPTNINRINIYIPNQNNIDDIVSQIARTRGAITRLFPIEERVNKLIELRKPGSIFRYRIEEVFLTFPFLISSFKIKFSPKKENENETIYEENYRGYFEKLSLVESSVDEKNLRDYKSLQNIKQSLERITTDVNLRIAVINDLFIGLLYSGSSTQELVTNMVSKIGHIELKEEAEMHLSAISQLADNLNKLIDKLDVYKIKKEQNIDTNLKNKLHQDKKDDKNKSDKSIYVISDEAQAAVGIMTEIEERKLLVEKLVRFDGWRKSLTTNLVMVYVIFIITLAIWGYIKFSSQFTLGSQPLSELKLAFIGVPWPVIIWSLIGSFAAMIYRFNRQPIHDFGNAIKWMITRPVQGVVLGSAFYLVLVSGLFLFTGGTSTNVSDTAKTSEEIILILSFLVGFSDRFADTVFNTLIDKYSKETKKQEIINNNEKK